MALAVIMGHIYIDIVHSIVPELMELAPGSDTVDSASTLQQPPAWSIPLGLDFKISGSV